MKIRSKILFTVAVAVFTLLSSKIYAQTNSTGQWRLGFGVEGGIPTGDITSFTKFELGGTVRLQYRLSQKLALTLTSGYYNFFAKEYTFPGTTETTKPDDLGIIPVKAGIRAFVSRHFYLAGEAGVGFETPGGPVKVILSPGFGYATRSWEIGARYENFWTNNNNFGVMALRVAYGFDL